mmetsp:Transcript_30823/g.34370  ORF Transcript_30823/g.34370 Transcript_30823/m.34370 type:complete len:273 (+) Transcript_30823:23-841(+)
MDLIRAAYAESEISEKVPSAKTPVCTSKTKKRILDDTEVNVTEIKPPLKKRRILPQLSHFFVEEKQESIEAHDGRKRTFKHVTGNYPTHIYIAVKHEATIVEKVLKPQALILTSDLEKKDKEIGFKYDNCEEYHISLARPFALRHHQIDPFLDKLRNVVGSIFMPTFHLSFDTLEFYVNDEETRSFISANVLKGKEEITQIIAHIDSVLSTYGFQEYYKNPKPHISLGWCLGNVRPLLTKSTSQINGKPISVSVSAVYCKVGKRVHRLSLES